MGRTPPPPSAAASPPLRKGAWTPEEDQKLIDYIKKHGHGNWRALPKKCGLQRCGKSCRLRWTNYLRPDIKRGSFTAAEEQRIIQLHALVGNKWAFIASQLPKRTDNEIKNYWNTVLKKRLTPISAPAITHGGGHLHDGISNTGMLRWNDSTATDLRMISSYTNMGGDQDGGGGGNSSCNRAKSNCHLTQWETARLEAEARLLSPPPPPPNSTKLSAVYHHGGAPQINAKSSGPLRRDWQHYNSCSPTINLNNLPGAAGSSAFASSVSSMQQQQQLARSSGVGCKGSHGTRDQLSTTTALADPGIAFLKPVSGGAGNDSHINLVHHNYYHMNQFQLNGMDPYSASAVTGTGSGGGTSHINIITARLAGRVGDAAKSGGGSRTSAIKLNGSNGRLSWNKHELSLPSLTTLGLHSNNTYARHSNSSRPSTASAIHHNHHHYGSSAAGGAASVAADVNHAHDQIFSVQSSFVVDRATPRPAVVAASAPMVDNLIDFCNNNPPSIAATAAATSDGDNHCIMSTPSLHDLLLELDGSCSAILIRSTATSTEHQSGNQRCTHSVSTAAMDQPNGSSCSKFWLAAAGAVGNDSSTTCTQENDHCSSVQLMMNETAGSANDFCVVNDCSGVVDCLELYSNNNCKGSGTGGGGSNSIKLAADRSLFQLQPPLDADNHHQRRWVAAPPAASSGEGAEIQFNNLLEIMDASLASY